MIIIGSVIISLSFLLGKGCAIMSTTSSPISLFNPGVCIQMGCTTWAYPVISRESAIICSGFIVLTGLRT